VIRQRAPKAQDFVNRRYRYRGVVDEAERAKNRTKSKVWAKRNQERSCRLYQPHESSSVSHRKGSDGSPFGRSAIGDASGIRELCYTGSDTLQLLVVR
jgi:hypothetical protein